MKKIIATGMFSWILLMACKKQDDLVFRENNNVYFDFTDYIKNTRIDSFFYSFALFPEKSIDTLLLPVRISGERASYDRWFKAQVIAEGTTALVGLHYKMLDSAYKIPADSGRTFLPLIISGSDPLLLDTSVVIKLKLMASSAFGNDFPSYDTAKVTFSNRLEQPLWWVVWESDLGVYSRVKHELFIRTSGTTELQLDNSDWQSTPKTLFYLRQFRAFMMDPIARAADYKDKGYAIGQEPDGTYYFYNTGNLNKKYPLEHSTADGRYYFHDENGNRIVPQ
ncbi:DUF4843 domain-containing protein [Chitinophaga sp. ARDCPP14]|uniref:DUF4843 domain-containing protein n=1 Tax=Chitinophaga sp. ARDCPP14 TaxID=3391139 RepID=UPI003F52309D